MQIVNGYMCQTGCDVAAAKHGHDPRNPHDDPVKAEALARARGQPVEAAARTADAAQTTGFSADAVQFGGSIAALSVPRGGSAKPVQLINRLA